MAFPSPSFWQTKNHWWCRNPGDSWTIPLNSTKTFRGGWNFGKLGCRPRTKFNTRRPIRPRRPIYHPENSLSYWTGRYRTATKAKRPAISCSIFLVDKGRGLHCFNREFPTIISEQESVFYNESPVQWRFGVQNGVSLMIITFCAIPFS